MDRPLRRALEESPIIAAVKDEAQLRRALESPCGIVFLLFGDVCSLPGLVAQVRESGRLAIVHLDLVAGLSQKSIAVDFVRQAGADGVITTRALLARRARELGLIKVLRIFAIDSMAIQNLRREQLQVQPDLIELMQGIIPKVIARVGAETDVPIIAGGLITDKSDVLAALSAGAVGISTSREELWRAREAPLSENDPRRGSQMAPPPFPTLGGMTENH